MLNHMAGHQEGKLLLESETELSIYEISINYL